jgi:acyl-CoA thioesterase I
MPISMLITPARLFGLKLKPQATMLIVLIFVSAVFTLHSSATWATKNLPENAPKSVNNTAPQKTIVVLGDSISAAYGLIATQGWVALTAEQLRQSPHAAHRNYRLQNASLSGDTTAGGVQRLPALLQQYHPAVLVIELGGNDALRGLSVAQTEANFKRMIALAKQAKAQVLLIPMQIPPNYGATYMNRFNALYAKLGKAQNVAVSPFIFKDFADNLSYFQADKLHPTAQAQAMMVNAVLPSLRALLK